MNSNKIIAFSLWGNCKNYNYGALENAILAKDIYPDWICYFYLGKDVIPSVIKYLETLSNVKIINKSDEENKLSNMLWRFEPAFISDDIIISRDCDSRLNIREKLAVDEWLNSDKDFHIMRDHNMCHGDRVLGGMWGARNGVLRQYKTIYDKHCLNKNNTYYYDMDLFNKNLYWKLLDNNKLYIHASYFKYEYYTNEFPHSEYKGFVGEEIYDCNIACNLLEDIDTKDFSKKWSIS